MLARANSVRNDDERSEVSVNKISSEVYIMEKRKWTQQEVNEETPMHTNYKDRIYMFI